MHLKCKKNHRMQFLQSVQISLKNNEKLLTWGWVVGWPSRQQVTATQLRSALKKGAKETLNFF
jgi:hypothetical protein